MASEKVNQSNEQALRAAISSLAVGYRKYTLNEAGVYSYAQNKKLTKKQFIDAIVALFKSQSTDKAVADLTSREDELEKILLNSIYIRWVPKKIDHILTTRYHEIQDQRQKQQRTALLSGDKTV